MMDLHTAHRATVTSGGSAVLTLSHVEQWLRISASVVAIVAGALAIYLYIRKIARNEGP
jgi:hypothetical protein